MHKIIQRRHAWNIVCSCRLECLDRYNEYLDTLDVCTKFQTAGINSYDYIAGFQTIDLLITIVSSGIDRV